MGHISIEYEPKVDVNVAYVTSVIKTIFTEDSCNFIAVARICPRLGSGYKCYVHSPVRYAADMIDHSWLSGKHNFRMGCLNQSAYHVTSALAAS